MTATEGNLNNEYPCHMLITVSDSVNLLSHSLPHGSRDSGVQGHPFPKQGVLVPGQKQRGNLGSRCDCLHRDTAQGSTQDAWQTSIRLAAGVVADVGWLGRHSWACDMKAYDGDRKQ
ncbi:hypothetical protein HaLaN_04610, partial [Haematococcus lacustris]